MSCLTCLAVRLVRSLYTCHQQEFKPLTQKVIAQPSKHRARLPTPACLHPYACRECVHTTRLKRRHEWRGASQREMGAGDWRQQRPRSQHCNHHGETRWQSRSDGQERGQAAGCRLIQAITAFVLYIFQLDSRQSGYHKASCIACSGSCQTLIVESSMCLRNI